MAKTKTDYWTGRPIKEEIDGERGPRTYEEIKAADPDTIIHGPLGEPMCKAGEVMAMIRRIRPVERAPVKVLAAAAPQPNAFFSGMVSINTGGQINITEDGITWTFTNNSGQAYHAAKLSLMSSAFYAFKNQHPGEDSKRLKTAAVEIGFKSWLVVTNFTLSAKASAQSSACSGKCSCKTTKPSCSKECGACGLSPACDGSIAKVEVVDINKLPCSCESPQMPQAGCQYHDAKRDARAKSRTDYAMKY